MTEFPAPTGFASAVARDLLSRARSYSDQHLSVWPGWCEPRIALVSELVVTIAGRGDRDSLIAALAVGGSWSPGRSVEALVGDILAVPQPRQAVLAAEDNAREQEATAKLPNASALLHRLLTAIVRDQVEQARQVRDRAAAELLAVQPDARLSAAETRATKAELQSSRAAAESARAKASEEELLRQVGLLRSELRFHAEQAGQDPEAYLAAVVSNVEAKTADPTDEPSEEEELPKGIRRRDSGKYEALVYRAESVSGKQRSCETFATLEEAIAAREAALQRELEPEGVAA